MASSFLIRALTLAMMSCLVASFSSPMSVRILLRSNAGISACKARRAFVGRGMQTGVVLGLRMQGAEKHPMHDAIDKVTTLLSPS